MVNRPSVPELITVNSEELQTLIRDLLPSQNGFGSELQATNVITPIIDLTATAEGSTLRTDLQTALAFGSQTAYLASNSTVVVANSPGFYRIIGAISIKYDAAGLSSAKFTMTDGASTKTIFEFIALASDNGVLTEFVDFTVWLAAGESISAVALNTDANIRGSVRQIADSEGKFVNPSGYPL